MLFAASTHSPKSSDFFCFNISAPIDFATQDGLADSASTLLASTARYFSSSLFAGRSLWLIFMGN